MSNFPRHANPSPPTSVHVEVKGSMDIPLHLGMLTDLGDPMMEQEILKEAVRIAVSERLGYFDGLDVRLSPSGGREGPPSKPNGDQHLQQLTGSPTAAAAAAATTRSYARRYCEVDLDLQRLGRCLEDIQRAYEELLTQVHVVHEVLSGTGPYASPLSGGTQSTQNDGTQQQQQQQASPFSSSMNLPSSDVLTDSARFSPDGMLGLNTPLFQTNTTSSSNNSSPRLDAAAVSTSATASVRYADAVQRLTLARQILDGVLKDSNPDVVTAAAEAAESRQQQREMDMMLAEHTHQKSTGQTCGDGKSEEEDATGPMGGDAAAMRQRRTRLPMDHEVGVDAELRRGLLGDDDEEGNSGEGNGQNNTNEDERDEDDLDEEAMHEHYRKAGYSPL